VKARLDFAMAHKNWSVKKWKSVLWSDETMVTLRSKIPKKVWRLPSEKYNIECIIPTIRQQKRVKLWGCFNYYGVGKLHRINGTLDATKFHGILQHQMLPSAKKLFKKRKWLFQQDNDPKHTAAMNQDYLHRKCVKVMKWPACSPDLNPIENLWKIMDDMTSERKPKTENELFRILNHAWKNMDKEYLKTLVKSMPNRCKEVIKNKGFPTKY
jgi:uncharacterized protein YbcC (UPF0753/DUF2309 family)